MYYVDPGAPEPVRSALVEGASWWAKAFEAAGFKNAFKVEVLPDDADPMDLRYNVIQWVHRSTRGWSYGSSVIDPRTGEILKGRVTLDSLRPARRPDRRRAYGGRAAPRSLRRGAGPGPEHLAGFDPTAEPAAMVLARIRQLSAHEVGHTLGLAHNFAASACGRASVMDYPAPLVKIRDDKTLDLSDAYARGIGAYDLLAVRYAYAQFPAGADAATRLREIVRQGIADGLLFLSDADARPAGAAHPLANLWDNGDDPVASLRHEMKVRAIGLERFGINNLADGAPLSDLEARLLPLYLHHRYQLQAAVKTLGGVRYTYAVKDGDDGPAVVGRAVRARRTSARRTRRRARNARPEGAGPPRPAARPDPAAGVQPPRWHRRAVHGQGRPRVRPGGRRRDRRRLGRQRPAQPPARRAPGRVARPRLESSRRSARWSRALVKKTWDEPPGRGPRVAAVARAVQWLVVTRLIGLAGDAGGRSARPGRRLARARVARPPD